MSSSEYLKALERMRDGMAGWNARCAGVALEVLEIQPADGVWSIKQNTFHLADAFEATTLRLRAMLTESSPQLLRFDADEWAADRDYQGRPWHTALAAINEQFGRLMSVAEAIPEQDLTRTGRQHNIAVNILGLPSELLTVLQLLEFEAAHIDEHTASIDEILARFGGR
ncbi:MAG TPA: DinB family protein [Pseudonocardiaceae bacterium]|nr:DinB family protein [Pseudonocardiaceae bacterium]